MQCFNAHWSQNFMVWHPCGTHGNRTQKYKNFKAKFEELFLERLHRIFPKTKNHVKAIEIGTPITTKFYLNAPDGESYGLELTPKRFSREVMENCLRKLIYKVCFWLESAFFSGIGRSSGFWMDYSLSCVRGVGNAEVTGGMEREKCEKKEVKKDKNT